MITFMLALALAQVEPSGIIISSPDSTWARTNNTDPDANNDDDVGSGSDWHKNSHAHAKRDHANHTTHVVDDDSGTDHRTSVAAANAGGESWAKNQQPNGRRVEGISLVCDGELNFETEGAFGDPEAFGAAANKVSYSSSTTTSPKIAFITINGGTESDGDWDDYVEGLFDTWGIPLPSFLTTGWGTPIADADAAGHNMTTYGMVFDMTVIAKTAGTSGADGNLISGDVTSNGEAGGVIAGTVTLTGNSE